MKKIICTIIIILLIPLILCSCGNKNYYVLEITGEELHNAFMNHKNFNLAIINTQTKKGQEELKNIKDISKKAKINIYYIENNHVDLGSQILINTLFDNYLLDNSYLIYQNGKIELNQIYTTYENMYEDLKDSSFLDKIAKVDNGKKEKNINTAQKLLRENKISESLDYLYKSWDLDEAKEYYKNNEIYGLINNWEIKTRTLEVPEITHYKNIVFSLGEETYYAKEIKEKSDKFKMPTSILDYDILYYEIKDDIIYTCKEKDGKYKKTFQIKKIDMDNNSLSLINLKTKKEEIYSLRRAYEK